MALESCPWLQGGSGRAGVWACNDGNTTDDAWGSSPPPPYCCPNPCPYCTLTPSLPRCNDRGGRAKCPREFPEMCAQPRVCAGGLAFCCSVDCKQYGGQRLCAGTGGLQVLRCRDERWRSCEPQPLLPIVARHRYYVSSQLQWRWVQMDLEEGWSEIRRACAQRSSARWAAARAPARAHAARPRDGAAGARRAGSTTCATARCWARTAPTSARCAPHAAPLLKPLPTLDLLPWNHRDTPHTPRERGPTRGARGAGRVERDRAGRHAVPAVPRGQAVRRRVRPLLVLPARRGLGPSERGLPRVCGRRVCASRLRGVRRAPGLRARGLCRALRRLRRGEPETEQALRVARAADLRGRRRPPNRRPRRLRALPRGALPSRRVRPRPVLPRAAGALAAAR
jgi:hypothetical protein